MFRSSVAGVAPSRTFTRSAAMMLATVADLGAELAAGRTTSRQLVEQALSRIASPEGEGSRAFVKVYKDAALAEADASDKLRALGITRSPIEGLPISVKDLFDVAGDVTRAGSVVLSEDAPATSDAPAVARLRAAGAIIVGRTNTVEFAFGGVAGRVRASEVLSLMGEPLQEEAPLDDEAMYECVQPATRADWMRERLSESRERKTCGSVV